MKIHAVGAELVDADQKTDGWADRQTDIHDETDNRLSQFCELS